MDAKMFNKILTEVEAGRRPSPTGYWFTIEQYIRLEAAINQPISPDTQEYLDMLVRHKTLTPKGFEGVPRKTLVRMKVFRDRALYRQTALHHT